MDHRTYASPFSWRYGRAELRTLFSEEERRKLWRAVWVSLAQAESAFGLITADEVADLRAHASEVDIEAALAIEREIHHDLMAEIRVFASQAKVGGGKLHLGATSMDIEDTVETYRLRVALATIGENLRGLLGSFATRARAHADLVCMAFTHLQPAEPTTLGYRLAVYAQDLLIDDANLRFVFEQLTTKGLRGAVGTAASYEHLLDHSGRSGEIEAAVLSTFGLSARDISTQTYTRKLDYLLLSALAGIGASLS
ncbi:MAG TPA: lyase family protein, partial [Candidatus Baltobacteraceae bacterium]|nr:lyase family protein [Candidatus Baltobacteraceae bacterium]